MLKVSPDVRIRCKIPKPKTICGPFFRLPMNSRRNFFKSFQSPIGEISEEPVPLISVSRAAMGGDFEISFDGVRYPEGTEIAMDALDQVDRLEKIMSVFRADSRIEYINKVAAFSPVPLEEELFEIIRISLQISEQTDGALDITSTPLWKIWGFSNHSPRVPANEEIAKALKNVDFRAVELDENRRTLRLKRPGIALNLGCIGKGFALDFAAETLEKAGIDDFLFHGGMSSVLSRGDFRKQGKTRGWTIGVAHPMKPGVRFAEITLHNESLGTSGSQKQFFRSQGRRFSHILDPRTGFPAESALMVSVLAQNATYADALSTAFFVMNPESVEQYCKDHPGISALLFLPTEKSPGFELLQFGFREDQLRILE